MLYEVLGREYANHRGVGIGLMVSVVGMVGLLVARIGARRAMLWALVSGALVLGPAVSLIQSLFPPYPLMMLTRVLEGVSHLAIVVVGPTAIAAPRIAAPATGFVCHTITYVAVLTLLPGAVTQGHLVTGPPAATQAENPPMFCAA